MDLAAEQGSVPSLEMLVELTKHHKPKVRKWASQRLMDREEESSLPVLQGMINDPVDEIAIPIMYFLAEKGQAAAAPAIMEIFRQAEQNLPAKSVLASWCAQALGKLNYREALPEFANYLKNHPEDVGLLGVSSALGDLRSAEARLLLRELLQRLESSRDGGVPYLNDVTVDALLRHGNPEDISTVLRMHQAWCNSGFKNPRTLFALARTTGSNDIYPWLESRVIREKAEMVPLLEQLEDQLELDLQEILGQEVYLQLLEALADGKPDRVSFTTLRAAEQIISKRYDEPDILRGGGEEQQQGSVTSRRQDQMALALLEGLADPRYRIHRSQLDPATSQRLVLLAISCLLEVAARIDYQQLLERNPSRSELIKVLTAKRRHVPSEVEEAAVSLGRFSEDEIQTLMHTLAAEEADYGRLRAARLLGRIAPAQAVAALVEVLDTGQDWLRREVVKALTRIGKPVLDYLETNKTEISPDIWPALAEVLAGIPDKRSAELACQAWSDPRIEKTDGLFMVHERVGSAESIAYLWDLYPEYPKMVGPSLELLCDIHQFEFPELAEVREANRIEEEELRTY